MHGAEYAVAICPFVCLAICLFYSILFYSILFYSILKSHDYGDVSAGAQPVLVYCTIGDYMIVMGMRSF